MSSRDTELDRLYLLYVPEGNSSPVMTKMYLTGVLDSFGVFYILDLDTEMAHTAITQGCSREL